ncbi:histidine--tRNA ligase [Eubacterium saphenum ATCC 49989]|nr:histidine--tRNA ligase [Eubacterium saphenum ATCC 49989]
MTNAPKGTKDLMPKETALFRYLENEFLKVASSYGYNEIMTPVIEYTELFSRGVGSGTDIVQKEMYTFKDLGGRSISLRPEGTAGVARAYVQSGELSKAKPVKYSYVSSCFRYEKPQSGRQRMFHQLGIECFGSKEVQADAEVIMLASDFLNNIGLKEITLKINSIGCNKCREKYKEALVKYYESVSENLCETCKIRLNTNPMRLLDCKEDECTKYSSDAPSILDFICSECANDFSKLQELLTDAGIQYEVDPRIVRGLDYYNKTAFEFIHENIGAKATVCGGGRYDNLINTLAGIEEPGIGFGIGLERLMLAIDSENIDKSISTSPEYVIIPAGENVPYEKIYAIAKMLRNSGKTVVVDIMNRNFKSLIKYANKINAKYALILGEDELKNEAVTVKNMASGDQKTVKISELVNSQETI